MELQVNKRAAVPALLAATLLVAVACGGSDDPAAPPVDTAEVAVVTAAPAVTPTPAIQMGFQSNVGEWNGVPAGTDAAPPGQAPELPGGAIGFSHYVFEKVGDRVVTTLVEGPGDHQVRVPASYRQLRQWAEAGEAGVDLRMSYEELSKLVGQLDTIRASTERFRDVEVALKEGYRQATDEVPNMGAHFVHPWLSLDGVFDPARPEILLYVRDDAGEWELVGTSFVQPLHVVGPDHPETFVGPLDNWHVHYELCTGVKFTSRSSTEAECKKDGGVWVPAYGWMVHAWACSTCGTQISRRSRSLPTSARWPAWPAT